MLWVSLGGLIFSFNSNTCTCISHIVVTQFLVLKEVWDLNKCLLYSQNHKCYNIVNECSYRVMTEFRIAASDLG